MYLVIFPLLSIVLQFSYRGGFWRWYSILDSIKIFYSTKNFKHLKSIKHIITITTMQTLMVPSSLCVRVSPCVCLLRVNQNDAVTLNLHCIRFDPHDQPLVAWVITTLIATQQLPLSKREGGEPTLDHNKAIYREDFPGWIDLWTWLVSFILEKLCSLKMF